MNKKPKKKMVKSIDIHIIICIFNALIVLSYLSACNPEAKIQKKSHEKQAVTYKFDATRIVNKVLDSTNIAYLYGFDEDGKFAIYKNDFINKYNVQITSKKYYLSEDCDSLEHSIEARYGKCWFLEFIQIDSISKDLYRLHYAVPYKERGGYYDININDYTIVDSMKVRFRARDDTVRYIIHND